jgi:hypothetical protein
LAPNRVVLEREEANEKRSEQSLAGRLNGDVVPYVKGWRSGQAREAQAPAQRDTAADKV